MTTAYCPARFGEFASLMPRSPWHMVQRIASVAPRPIDGAPGCASSCGVRSEEHTSELQSLRHLVCRLLLEKKKQRGTSTTSFSSRATRKDRPPDGIARAHRRLARAAASTRSAAHTAQLHLTQCRRSRTALP